MPLKHTNTQAHALSEFWKGVRILFHIGTGLFKTDGAQVFSRWYRIGNRNEELQQRHNENGTYENKNAEGERQCLYSVYVRSPPGRRAQSSSTKSAKGTVDAAFQQHTLTRDASRRQFLLVSSSNLS